MSMRYLIELYFASVQSLIKAKAKKVGKAGPIVEKIRIPVEKDVNKLVNYVCGSNIYVDGTDIKVNFIYHKYLFRINLINLKCAVYLVETRIRISRLAVEFKYWKTKTVRRIRSKYERILETIKKNSTQTE